MPDPDLIGSWNDLEEYCDQLGVDVIKREDRVILCAISGNPPTVSFSVTFRFYATADPLKFLAMI